jgi:uncharacterized protein
MKRISILLLAACVLLAGTAYAGELTLKTTEKYFTILNLKGTMAQMIELAGSQMMASTQYYYSQDMRRRGMSDADIKTATSVIRTNITDLKNVMLKNIDQLLPVKEIISDIYYPVLKRHFSEEEIIELTKFYQTTLGRKVVDKMPVVMNESAQMLNQSPKYIPRIQKFVAGEMEKRRDVIKQEIDKEIEKAHGKKDSPKDK